MRNVNVHAAHAPSANLNQLLFEEMYKKCATNFIANDLNDYHILAESALPVRQSALLVSHLFIGLDDDTSDNFAIVDGDNNLTSSCSHTPTDMSHTGILCFRVLRSNPAQMAMLPGAPKISDYKACVAVLEHVVAKSSAESCRIVQTTDGDLEDRTIVIAPGTFDYDEMRCMRRARLDSVPVYDFGDDVQLPDKCAASVITEVVHSLLHTMMLDGHNDFCYVLTSTSARRKEQLEVLESLERLALVKQADTDTSSYGETQWRMTPLGQSKIRLTYGFGCVEPIAAPLPGRVRVSFMEAFQSLSKSQ